MSTAILTAARLNFACGPTLAPGFDNSDIDPVAGARHVDLDDFPYPYLDDSAEIIMLSHCLCLRPQRFSVLQEFHRILRPGGWLRIDDNPHRFYVDGVAVSLHESVRGFPDERRVPRADLREWLCRVGFAEVTEVPAGETGIPADGDLLTSIVHNARLHHESFTVEARK